MFSGPEDSLLELRCQGKQWSLLVNGITVEDYNPSKRASGDESLRELRSRPDGAYIISPQVDARELDLNVVRKFSFVALGKLHEVCVAHSDCIWQVLSGGNLVDRIAHKISDSSGEAAFDIEVAPEQKVRATVSMTWDSYKWLWRYTLTIQTEGVCGTHSQDVPFSWSKISGQVAGVEPPIVVAAEDGVAVEPVSVQQEPPPTDDPPQNLPQGVSFDSSTGSYQANIRAKTGRFVFLGEFRTPDEAHQRYLEAVPVHCPEKQLAPDLM